MQINHVYWLAGLLEGEGCFHPDTGSSIMISVSMTDRDAVEKVASLLGDTRARRVTTRKSLTTSGKPVFGTQVYGSRAAGWMMTLYQLMGERRRKKIRECLTIWRKQAIPARDRQTCAFGHPFATVKRGLGSRRICLICAAERNRTYVRRKVAGLVPSPSGVARCGHRFDTPDLSCRTCAVREAGRRFRDLHRRRRSSQKP